MIIDGRQIAENVLSELRKLPIPTKKFVGIMSGDNTASLSFLRQKEKVASDLDIQFELQQFSDSLSQEDLESAVCRISESEDVGGIIVQLPLPAKYNRDGIINSIDINKDVDALREGNTLHTPAVLSLEYILADIGFNIAGKKAVVVGGRGFLIGQPIAQWLVSKGVNVVIVEKDFFDVDALKSADLVISGTGQPNLIKGEHLKQNVVVIDYGYGIVDGKICGDVEIESVSRVASYVTPTPGGTGPLVVAGLFSNFYNSFRNKV